MVFGLLALLIASVAYYFYFSGPEVFKRRMAAGDQFLAAHKFEEAAREYKEAAAVDMTNPLPYEKLYKTFLRQKDADQADSLFISARSNLQGESIEEFWTEVDKLNAQNPYFVYQSYEDILAEALDEYQESRMEATSDLQRDMSGLWLADLIQVTPDSVPDLLMAVPGKGASDPGQIKIFHYNHSEPLLVGSVDPFDDNGLHEIWISRYEDQVCLVSGSLEEGFELYGINPKKLTLDSLLKVPGTKEIEEKKQAQAKKEAEEKKKAEAQKETPENQEQNKDDQSAETETSAEDEKSDQEAEEKQASSEDDKEKEIVPEEVISQLDEQTIFKAAVNTVDGSLTCMDTTLETLNTLYEATGDETLETFGIREAQDVVYTPEEILTDLETRDYVSRPGTDEESAMIWQLEPGTLQVEPGTLQVEITSSPAAVNTLLERLLDQEPSLKDVPRNLKKDASGYQVISEQSRTTYVPDGNGLLIFKETTDELDQSVVESLVERWGLNPDKIQILDPRENQSSSDHE